MKGLIISMFDYELLDAELLADIVSVSKATLLKWEKTGKLPPPRKPASRNSRYIPLFNILPYVDTRCGCIRIPI